MIGKEKCKALKEIRKQIAENNDIEYAVSECKHQGDCKGTCPKCEAELRYLERELEKRAKLGKTVVVAGLSAIAALGMTGCNGKGGNTNELSGDVPDTSYVNDIAGGEAEYIPETSTELQIDGEVSTIDNSTTEEELAGDVEWIDEPTTEASTAEGTISK